MPGEGTFGGGNKVVQQGNNTKNSIRQTKEKQTIHSIVPETFARGTVH